MGEAKNNLPYDVCRTVNDLRDKFKHGHHIIKILESQLETARQNISLLQGQVRLANETIDNLKLQFNEADLILSYLTDNSKGNKERKGESLRPPIRENDGYGQGNAYGQRSEEYSSQLKIQGIDRRSPKPTAMQKSSEATEQISEHDSTERPKSPSCQGKVVYGQDRPKSPYEQQLRQVLDALQDEDPRRMGMSVTQEREVSSVSQSQPQMCMCPECVPHSSSSVSSAHRQYQDAPSRAHPCNCDYSGSEVHYQEDCSKHSMKVSRAANESPINSQNSQSIHETHREDTSSSRNIANVAHVSRSMDYSSRCTGPCCTSVDPAKGYKIIEASPGMSHYISSRPTRHRHQHQHDANGKMLGHCDDKCRCHAFVNYAPYGYQVVESAPGIPQTIQPISPNLTSKKNKRYLPVAPGDEPPHLKYTKVKRIDGSKVAAQKTIQDFSKRRFHPYNPRWDLDLLIVPPPIPALDLLSVVGAEQNCSNEMEKEGASTSTSADDQVQIEASATSSDGYESAIVKSKVINSGGTVIVLTEGDTLDLNSPVVLHSTPKVHPLEVSADRSRSAVDPSMSFDDKLRLPQESPKFHFESSSVKVSSEKNPDEERRHQMEPNIASVDKAMLQSISGLQTLRDPPAQLGVSESFTIQTKNSTVLEPHAEFNRSLSYSSVSSDAQFKIPDSGSQNASVITSASIKKERNNNSFPTNAISLMLQQKQQQQQKQTDHNEGHKELSSNLTARYEQVLFQRNQDFSKIGSDDDYIIQNRIKGKVH